MGNTDLISNIQIADLLTAHLPSPTTITELATQQLLQKLCPNGTITPSVCTEILKFTEKETKVKTVCDLSKVKVRPDDGRIYIILNRRSISSTSYPGLVDKLYEHFFGISKITLKDFFEVWIEWRAAETAVSDKTIKENRYLWNALLRDKPLVQKPLKDLTVQDYIAYFRSITKGRTITRKRFNDLKSILNGMNYLAVEREIII